MELNFEPAQSDHAIRRVGDGVVVVGSRVLDHSFVVTREQLQDDLPERDMDDIGDDTVERLLALEPRPEVVLLGSGATQRFAPASVRAGLMQRGIGLECMDNAACARTFNLLVNEGRHVAAAFLIA